MVPATRFMLRKARALPIGAPVPSPCVSVCRLEPVNSLCEGCFRTLDEIAAWSVMTDADKRLVWQALPARAGLETP